MAAEHREDSKQHNGARRRERARVSGERSAARSKVDRRIEQTRDVRVLVQGNERGARHSNGERANALRKHAGTAPHADDETGQREDERETRAGSNALEDSLRDFSPDQWCSAHVEQRQATGRVVQQLRTAGRVTGCTKLETAQPGIGRDTSCKWR